MSDIEDSEVTNVPTEYMVIDYSEALKRVETELDTYDVVKEQYPEFAGVLIREYLAHHALYDGGVPMFHYEIEDKDTLEEVHRERLRLNYRTYIADALLFLKEMGIPTYSIFEQIGTVMQDALVDSVVLATHEYQALSRNVFNALGRYPIQKGEWNPKGILEEYVLRDPYQLIAETSLIRYHTLRILNHDAVKDIAEKWIHEPTEKPQILHLKMHPYIQQLVIDSPLWRQAFLEEWITESFTFFFLPAIVMYNNMFDVVAKNKEYLMGLYEQLPIPRTEEDARNRFVENMAKFLCEKLHTKVTYRTITGIDEKGEYILSAPTEMDHPPKPKPS